MGFKRINPYSPVFSRGKSGRKWLRFAQVFQLLKGPTGCGCSGGVHPNPPMIPRKPWWATAVKVSTKWFLSKPANKKNMTGPFLYQLIGGWIGKIQILPTSCWNIVFFGAWCVLNKTSTAYCSKVVQSESPYDRSKWSYSHDKRP